MSTKVYSQNIDTSDIIEVTDTRTSKETETVYVFENNLDEDVIVQIYGTHYQDDDNSSKTRIFSDISVKKDTVEYHTLSDVWDKIVFTLKAKNPPTNNDDEFTIRKMRRIGENV